MKKLFLYTALILIASYNTISNDNHLLVMFEESLQRQNDLHIQRTIQFIEEESGIIIPCTANKEHIMYAYNLANELEIPIRIAFRLIYRESRFQEDAVSRVGAYGLMQLMPNTELWFGNKLNVDYMDFENYNFKNIYIGMHYLKHHYVFWTSRYTCTDTAWIMSLASYNAGRGRVIAHRGIPPFEETINYVNFIFNNRII